MHDNWLSNILDAHVDMHEKKWGCAWNKDIEKIVRGERRRYLRRGDVRSMAFWNNLVHSVKEARIVGKE